MFTNIRYGSKENTDENIDVCTVQENCAWVLDGADALFPTHITSNESDGEWFVKELNFFLKKNISQPFVSIADILKRGIGLIHEEFLKFPEADKLFDLEMPSACCAIVRVRRDKLSYFIMGNCEIKLSYTSGETLTITDMRLQELDAKLLEISQDARRKQRMPLFRAQSFMDNMLVENRLRRNVEGGYYVIGESPDVVNHAVVGTIPIKNMKTISLICNGFSQYFNCKKVKQNLEGYIERTRNEELVTHYDKLLERKAKNSKVAHYMQDKLSGQSTMVFFDIEDRNLLEKE